MCIEELNSLFRKLFASDLLCVNLAILRLKKTGIRTQLIHIPCLCFLEQSPAIPTLQLFCYQNWGINSFIASSSCEEYEFVPVSVFGAIFQVLYLQISECSYAGLVPVVIVVQITSMYVHMYAHSFDLMLYFVP